MKLLGALLALGTLLVAGALGLALFPSSEPCAEPACARERFSLHVELDSFRGVEPLATEAAGERGVVSPASILGRGGVRVQIEHDQTNLPYVASSGPLDRADLHRYAQVWRARSPPDAANAGLYALVTPALVSDAGEALFGIMFDFSGREGFAVAPGETARVFKDHHEDSIALLQLRTFTHELLHALNRRHLDAAQVGGRLTLEAPTRCISRSVEAGRWLLLEPPLMAISASTIRFFQTAEARDVLPGVANAPFKAPRTSTTECMDARRNYGPAPALTRWELMRKRLSQLLSLQTANAQSEQEHSDPVAQVQLQIQAQEAAYPLGYPLAIRVMATNSGEIALPLRDRLSPAYGVVEFERRAEGDDEWRTFKPLTLYEPASDRDAMLASGQRTEQTVPLFFGQDGWTFARPGAYEIRARLSLNESSSVTSNVAGVRVRAPDGADDTVALQPLLDRDDRLDVQVGRLLTFGGRIGQEPDLSLLETVAHTYGHTALGSALRLTLVSQQLNPPIDPLTGERSLPELSSARELLADTCSDSGVAALKDELLDRFSEAAPAEMTPGLNDSASAWDGVTASGESVATYSDPRLGRMAASLHFCLDETAFSASVRPQAALLARQIRAKRPERIVIVGHADQSAGCKYNDKLALRRAESMKRVLLDAGVPAARIRTASLGKRRPLDFSTSEAARLLNRRVEVLIDADKVDADSDPRRVQPRCDY